MPSEHELFSIGDRVRLNERGLRRASRTRSTTGKVVGFGRSDNIVRVLLDGMSRPISLHQSYLDKDKPKL